jgi:hypothetical protein
MRPLPVPMIGLPIDQVVGSPFEWSTRTLQNFEGFFEVVYSGRDTSPDCVFIVRKSNHHQSTKVFRYHNTQLTLLLPLKEDAALGKGWFTSDLPQSSPVVYRIYGYCYPYDEERPDYGVQLTAKNYQNGFHLEMHWMDVGDVDGHHAPDWKFQNNYSEFFLELTYGTDYNTVDVDQALLRFTLRYDPSKKK